MTLATDKNELIVIYNPDATIGKQALGYAQSSGSKTNLINIAQAGLTGTQWSEVAAMLGASLDELIAKDHPDVSSILNDATLSDDDWIHFIQKNPVAIQQPILIQGNKAKQISSPSEVMQFIGVDRAGLKKHPIGDVPETTSNTKGETQV